MFPIEAESSEKLRGILLEDSIDVYPKGQGQKTEQSEKWIMRHFLLAVSCSGPLGFPVRVEHRDKPDFLLSWRSGRIGIEVTEAVHPDAAEITAYRNKNKITNIRFVECWLPGQTPLPERSKREERKEKIQEIAHGRGNPLPCMGDKMERDWVIVMKHVIEKKARKFAQNDFIKYDQNWLLIYDDWDGLSGVSLEESTSMLQDWLLRSEEDMPFERIFVLKNKSVFEFANDLKVVEYPPSRVRVTPRARPSRSCWPR